jgi:ASC-1-like (ASCH) protein
MHDKVQLNQYMLSPRVSIFKMLEDFVSTYHNMQITDLSSEIKQVEDTLKRYKNFRKQSREKRKDK